MTKKALGASGGPLDEFKDKAVGNFAKGWKGGEVIPGVGFTRMLGADRLVVGSPESRKASSQDKNRPRFDQRRGVLYGGLTTAYSVMRDANVGRRTRAATTQPAVGLPREIPLAPPIPSAPTGAPAAATPPPAPARSGPRPIGGSGPYSGPMP